MEPYGEIKPFEVKSSPLTGALDKMGSKSSGPRRGGLLDMLGGLSGQRAVERMHQAQIAHEGLMQQANHESTLEQIRLHHAEGRTSDQEKASQQLEQTRLEGQNERRMEKLKAVNKSKRLEDKAIVKYYEREHVADLEASGKAQDAALEISKANAKADRKRNAAREAGVIERKNREHQVDQLHKLVGVAAPGTSVNFEEPGKFKVGMTLAPAEKPAEEKKALTPAEKRAKTLAANKAKAAKSAKPKVDTKAAEAYND